MLRKTLSQSVFAIACWLALTPAVATASAFIALEWRPASQTVTVGETFDIGFYATMHGDPPEVITAMEVILVWEPGFLEFVGKTDNGPYDWLSSRFPVQDPEGLNAGVEIPPLGVPTNDGDAIWQGLAQFYPKPPLVPTQDGVLLTTMRFQALAEISNTQVIIPESLGVFGRTVVLIDFLMNDVPYPLTLGDAQVTIVPEPGSLMLLALGTIAWSFRRGRRSRAA